MSPRPRSSGRESPPARAPRATTGRRERKTAAPPGASTGAATGALATEYAGRLLAWFDVSGRHDLPWQHPRTPYRVWLSEIMLQQTQVRVVIPYFERFVAALPDLPALAAASQDTVMALWSGLGYYARARNLHATAKRCMDQHGGDLPRDLDALVALPGIGRSTAGAILSQAWGDPFPILDGNVKRVLSRVFGIEGWPGLPANEKRLWAIAESLLPGARLADYTQAQMDFGATLCTRHDPACMLCPLRDDCVAQREGRTDELPTPKPGKPLPERWAVLLLLRDAEGRVLLQRRPPTGIWAALWSLPEAPDHDTARHWFDAHVAGDYDDATALDDVHHGFTHYRLLMHPRAWRGVALREATGENVDDNAGDVPSLRWVSRAEFDTLGIPAPIRALITRPS